MKLACQEHLLPGADLPAKWESANRLGFQGIELRGHGDFAFRERLPELRAARKAGAVFPTVCVIMDHFIGDFDRARREDAIANMKSLLSVIGELGGIGAVTPAAYGLFSNYLPPFKAPRTHEDDRKVLFDGLGRLGDHARDEGVLVLFEPLNRYEDHMCNTIADGAGICRALGHPNVKLMADLFHMNIEERDLAAAIEKDFDLVAHIHAADSQRYEPGTGHTDFQRVLRSLSAKGYQGHLALECMLTGEAEASLRTAVNTLTLHSTTQ